MTKLGLALFLVLGLAPAQAQVNFTLPPPAGVVVGGVMVVTTCGSVNLANGSIAFLAMDHTGALCTNASGGGGGGGLSVVDQTTWAQGVSAFTPTGCVFNDTATLSSGQEGTLRCTTDRQAKVLDSAVLAAVQAPVPTQDASVSIGGVGIVPTALAAGGITPVVCGSAVSSCVLKASAGNLYSAYAECTAACWLMIFNSVSAPSNGSTTAGTASGNLVECIDISAGSSKSLSFSGMPPEVYSVGITAAISNTACATLTLSAVAFVKGSVK